MDLAACESVASEENILTPYLFEPLASCNSNREFNWFGVEAVEQDDNVHRREDDGRKLTHQFNCIQLNDVISRNTRAYTTIRGET